MSGIDLGDLGDVNLAGIADDDVLVWDAGTTTWLPEAAGSGDIWEDQTIEVQCVFEGDSSPQASNLGAFTSTYGQWRNYTTTDTVLIYAFPLPTRIGSLSFYVTNVHLHIDDADADDYVTATYTDEILGSNITNTNISNTNWTTIGEKVIVVNAFADANYGLGAIFKVALFVFCTGSGHSDIAGVSIEGYYT